MESWYLWISYGIILLISVKYFYSFPHLVPKGHLADSIVMANGLASAVSLVIFAWLLPEIFRFTPLYPGPATLVNFFLVIFYGVHLGRNMRPVPLEPTKDGKS